MSDMLRRTWRERSMNGSQILNISNFSQLMYGSYKIPKPISTLPVKLFHSMVTWTYIWNRSISYTVNLGTYIQDKVYIEWKSYSLFKWIKYNRRHFILFQERCMCSSSFPHSFTGGMFDTIWWSYVTMTTVG